MIYYINIKINAPNFGFIYNLSVQIETRDLLTRKVPKNSYIYCICANLILNFLIV